MPFGKTEKIIIDYLLDNKKKGFITLKRIIEELDYNADSKLVNIYTSLRSLLRKGIVLKEINTHKGARGGSRRSTSYKINPEKQELAESILFDDLFL